MIGQLKEDIKEIVSCWQTGLYFNDTPFGELNIKNTLFPILRFEVAPNNSGQIQIGANRHIKRFNIRIGVWEQMPQGCTTPEDVQCQAIEDIDIFIEYILMIKDILVNQNYVFFERGRGYKVQQGTSINLNIAAKEKTEHRLFGVLATFTIECGSVDFCCNKQFIKPELLSAKGKRHG